MKKKIIGLILLVCVMGVIGGIYLLTGGTGELGEEKRTEGQQVTKTKPATQVSGVYWRRKSRVSGR